MYHFVSAFNLSVAVADDSPEDSDKSGIGTFINYIRFVTLCRGFLTAFALVTSVEGRDNVFNFVGLSVCLFDW